MRSLALTIFVFGLVPFCLTRPWIGVLAWNWLGLMAPHKLSWGFARSFSFAELVAIATLAGVIITKDRKPVPWNSELVLVMGLTGLFAVTCVFAWMPELAWAKWLDFLKIILMVLVGTAVIFGKERIRLLLIVIALSIGFFGFKGGIWSILTGGTDQVLGPEESYLSGNTFLGLAMVMVIPLLFMLARQEKNKWSRRLFLGHLYDLMRSGITIYLMPEELAKRPIRLTRESDLY